MFFIAFGLVALSGCQEISVDTERLQPPTIFNGQADGRFVVGHASATVTISDSNSGSTIRYQINGGAAQTYTLPLTLTANTQIDAWVERPGLRDSAVVSKQFTLAWEKVTDLNSARYDHSIAGSGSLVYVMGGFIDENGGMTASCELVDLANTIPSVSPANPLNSARAYFLAGVIDGNVFAFSHTSVGVINHDFNTPNGVWAVALDMPIGGRTQTQATVIGSTLYAPFGVKTSTGLPLNSILEYDSSSASADTGGFSVSPYRLAVASFGSKIFCLGGLSTKKMVRIFDVASGSIEEVITAEGLLYDSTAGSAVSLSDGRIVLITGTQVQIRNTNGSWYLDLLPVPDGGREYAAAYQYGDEIYLFGGVKPGSAVPEKSIYKFTPP